MVDETAVIKKVATGSEASVVPTGLEYWREVALEFINIGPADSSKQWEYIVAALMLWAYEDRSEYDQLSRALRVELENPQLIKTVDRVPRLGYNDPKEEMQVLARHVFLRLHQPYKGYLMTALNNMASESRYRSVVVQIILDWTDPKSGIFPGALTCQTLHHVMAGRRYNRVLRRQALRQLAVQQNLWEYQVSLEQLQRYCALLGANPLQEAAYISLVAPNEWELIQDKLLETTEVDAKRTSGLHFLDLLQQVKRIIAAKPQQGVYGLQRLLDIYDTCCDSVQLLLCTAAVDICKHDTCIYHGEDALWIRVPGTDEREVSGEEYVLLQQLAEYSSDFEDFEA